MKITIIVIWMKHRGKQSLEDSINNILRLKWLEKNKLWRRSLKILVHLLLIPIKICHLVHLLKIKFHNKHLLRKKILWSKKQQSKVSQNKRKKINNNWVFLCLLKKETSLLKITWFSKKIIHFFYKILPMISNQSVKLRS